MMLIRGFHGDEDLSHGLLCYGSV